MPMVVHTSNQMAVRHLGRWPDWGMHRMARLCYIYGGVGSGKTDWAIRWSQKWWSRRKTNVVWMQGLEDLFEPNQGYVLELSAESWLDEAALFRCLNRAIDRQSWLVMTGLEAPYELSFALPDLASRFRALPCFDLGAIDTPLLHGLVLRFFHERQLRVVPEVVEYLLIHSERSPEALRHAVALLDRVLLDTQQSLSLSLVRRLFPPRR